MTTSQNSRTKETIQKLSELRTGKKLSEKTKKKISEANKGREFSKEHKDKLSKARKVRKITEATRLKMSESSKGKINTKKFKLVSPDGKIHYTTNGLAEFCRQHQLVSSNLCKVLKGERDNHKGWRIEHADYQINS